MFPERFANLPAYAFPRLRSLLDGHAAGGDAVHMTIGEPKHPFPDWVGPCIAEHAKGFAQYPINEGSPDLLHSISHWISRRYRVEISKTRLMALNGTREGLYNAMMALCPEVKNGQQPIVLLPNPFYQVYLVAALSVGAKPQLLPATLENGFLPDFSQLPTDVLNRISVVYLCSPSNPQGAVASRDYWRDLIHLAEKYDFRIFADECYSEIYRNTPPTGVLEVAAELNTDPERIVAFHSLSKRSNVPGLRSGFVVGGEQSIKHIRQLRSYAGSPVPMPVQAVSTRLWADEDHVIQNRALYQEKYKQADEIFQDTPGYYSPKAGFFLWLPVEDGETAALRLWQQTGIRVLPGAYLARDTDGQNPARKYIRVAMVAPINEMAPALIRLRDCLYS